MELHLFLQVGVELTAMEQHRKPSCEFAKKAHGFASLSGLNDACNGSDDTLELRDLGCELFSACRRQLVVARSAISCGGTPLRGYPTLDQHSLQCGIKRSLFDLQDIVRGALDRVGNLVSVHLSDASNGFQDQKIECPRGDFVTVHMAPRGFDILT